VQDILDDFSSQILIVVTTHNRANITELTLKNLTATKRQAGLWVLDDHSSEYDLDFLKSAAPTAERVERRDKKLGIDYQRFLTQLEAFETQYKYIYHTDNDAIHDPDWIARLHQLSLVYPQNPICLYNTIFHLKNTVKVIEAMAIAARKFCPGISFFYDQEKLRPSKHLILELLNTTKLKTNWDFYFSHLLGQLTVTSLMSYVEHFGAGGLHNTDFDRDRAFSPTPYLVGVRPEIIKFLITSNG
jgi:hypothetical protein